MFQTAHADEQVAVKSPPDSANDEIQTRFIAEINIMQDIEPHQNIVKFIGQVTTVTPLMLVIEYCANGCLRDYLRNVSVCTPTYLGILAGRSHSSDLISYPTFASQGRASGTEIALRSMVQCLSDIAAGMAHLARFRIVHRDLAA